MWRGVSCHSSVSYRFAHVVSLNTILVLNGINFQISIKRYLLRLVLMPAKIILSIQTFKSYLHSKQYRETTFLEARNPNFSHLNIRNKFLAVGFTSFIVELAFVGKFSHIISVSSFTGLVECDLISEHYVEVLNKNKKKNS